MTGLRRKAKMGLDEWGKWWRLRHPPMREYNYHRRPHGNPRVERKLFALRWGLLFLGGMAVAGYLVYLSTRV